MQQLAELSLEETKAFLFERVQRHFGKIPTDLIVEQVLRVTVGADFPVRRAALEAMERRMQNATREGLHIEVSPEGASPWGRYQVAKMVEKPEGRRRRVSRPYSTELFGINPLAASCSCPDFCKGSLGLCKHVLAVLSYWHDKPKRALRLQAPSGNVGKLPEPRLDWDSIAPFLGSGDRLLGLTWHGTANGGATGRVMKSGRVELDLLADPVKRVHFLRQAFSEASPSGKKRPSVAADAATLAMLREELSFAEGVLLRRQEAERARPFLKKLKRTLYPYQADGAIRFLEQGRLLLADDMGLGKTTQAIAACHALHAAGVVKRGLIVTPAALKAQWLREWQATTDAPVQLVDGNLEERKRLYHAAKKGYLIVNYELVLRDFEFLVPWAEQLVVLDEAQRIKNYATKSAVYIKALPAERRLVLTGTPMENRLDELASILDWIDDRALAPKWRLPAWYIRYDGDGMKSRVGARNLDTLRSRLSPCLVRRLRTEVLTQLPRRSDTRVPVAMTAEQRDEHDELFEPLAKLAAIAAKRPLTQAEFLRLMQLLTTQRMIANGLGQLRFDELWPSLQGRSPSRALLDGLFAPKLDEFRRLIESLVVDQGRKVVVFSQWRRMLKLADWSIRDIAASASRRTLFFTGAESAKLRTQSLVEFHDDPKASVLFLSDAGGVGLNLQKAANACINLELPWNPAVLEQRIGRIYRLGQKDPIDVYNLVSEASIESRIATVVGTKQALFKGLFDGTSNEVNFEEGGGFIAEVRKILDLEQPVAPELPQHDSILPEDGLEGSDGVEFDSGDDAASDRQDSDTLPADGGYNLDPATLLGQLQIERDEAGGLSIRAPAQIAGTIADLFETMAKMLRKNV